MRLFGGVFFDKNKGRSWKVNQEYNFFILGPFQCSLCKYPHLHKFIKGQQKTFAGQTLYGTISLHIIGEGKIYLNRDMEKPGSFDHFPKGTGCTPWFFWISTDIKLNCAFNNSGLNSKKREKKVKILHFSRATFTREEFLRYWL